MEILKKSDFNVLVDNIFEAHSVLYENTKQVVNQNLTLRNYFVGYLIVEYEQKGLDRAEYGSNLIVSIAGKLKERGIKGLGNRMLNYCRSFYLSYPQILQSVIAKFNELGNVIRIPDYNIMQSPIAELDRDLFVSPDLLLSRLSFTHFIELLRIDDPLVRCFYEVETINNNWSVRELERAIDTLTFERTGLSRDKKRVIRGIGNVTPVHNREFFKDPYILDFLNLEEKAHYSETDFEQSILDNLQHFLMELGNGFCFEARQKRITFGNTHYWIDLVFYHRFLRCNVLIDLKLNKFSHGDAGQMNMYLNYFKKNEMCEGDNEPIGMILCADKDNTLVEYATGGMDNNLFVSKYLVNLPEKKKIEEFIRKEMKK